MLNHLFKTKSGKLKLHAAPDGGQEEKIEGTRANDEAGSERVLLEAIGHDAHDGEKDLRGGP